MKWLEKDLQDLKGLIGGRALRYLRDGKAVLHIWRNSSPHNWWVETKSGKYLWHSDDDRRFRRLPDLRLFKHIEDSSERVIQYWGGDSGSPCQSTYVLKRSSEVSPPPKFFNGRWVWPMKVGRRWAYAINCSTLEYLK